MKHNLPETSNYSDMLAYAKKLHPQATVTHDGSYSTWVISINTNTAVDLTLPERFKETPAWDVSKAIDHDFKCELLRWARFKHYWLVPIDGIAEVYNNRMGWNLLFTQERNRMCDEAFGGEFVYRSADIEKISHYAEILTEAKRLADNVFADELRTIHDKWNMGNL